MKLSVLLVLVALLGAAFAGPAHSIDVEGPGCTGEVISSISGGDWEQENGNWAAVYELSVQNNGVCAMSTIQLALELPEGATIIDTWELNNGSDSYLLSVYPTLEVGATGIAGFIAEFPSSPAPASVPITLTARCPRSCMENSPTEGPVDPTEEPVESSEAPVESSEAPVESSSEEPTEGPVDPTEEPVESSEAPVESSSEAPVESSSEVPVESSSEVPVESSEAPVESSSEVPVESSSEAPVESSEAPVESSEAPVESSEAPVESSEAPVESSEEEPISCSASVSLQAREGGSIYSQVWDVNITNTGNVAISALAIDIVATEGSDVSQIWDLSSIEGNSYQVEFWGNLGSNGAKHDGAGFEVVGNQEQPSVSVSAVVC